MPRSSRAVIKTIHTLAWAAIEASMLYVLYAGFRKRSDRRAAIGGAIVTTECLVFAANGFRCPLTDLAEARGATSGSVTDIYLPKWLAHNLPLIHVPLVAAAIALHVRNLRHRRVPGSRPWRGARSWNEPST